MLHVLQKLLEQQQQFMSGLLLDDDAARFLSVLKLFNLITLNGFVNFPFFIFCWIRFNQRLFDDVSFRVFRTRRTRETLSKNRNSVNDSFWWNQTDLFSSFVFVCFFVRFFFDHPSLEPETSLLHNRSMNYSSINKKAFGAFFCSRCKISFL